MRGAGDSCRIIACGLGLEALSRYVGRIACVGGDLGGEAFILRGRQALGMDSYRRWKLDLRREVMRGSQVDIRGRAGILRISLKKGILPIGRISLWLYKHRLPLVDCIKTLLALYTLYFGAALSVYCIRIE